VATLWHTGLAEHEVDQGVDVYRMRSTAQRAGWLFSEPGRRHTPPWPDPEAIGALRRIIARHQPDIVHAHNWLVFSFLPLKAHSGARLVLTLHDYSLNCAKKRFMYRARLCAGPRLLKCMACAGEHYGIAKGVPIALGHWVAQAFERPAVDMFLPVSQAVAAGSGLVGGRWPYQVIPNFVPDRPAAGDAIDPALIAQLPPAGFAMFAGDLSFEKGIDVLLRAYAALTNPPPLVLIGRQPPGQPLVTGPNVTVLNDWPHAAVLEAWRRCSVALVPSVWPEPFGLVVLEAMAAGRPVIASRTGGLADIVVNNETGLLVPPGDAPALTAALARLLASPELREQMGQAGQRRLAQYRADAILPRLEQVYRALLSDEHPAKSQPLPPGQRAVGKVEDG
jgi:glycosyltransferase involved in cell wall biosynthesis